MTQRKDKYSQDHLPKIFEYSILIIIVLVIVLMVVEDLAIIYNWSHETHEVLIWLTFIFDLIFTVEFAARSIITARQGYFGHYFKHQRGWIDLLTSIPLLLLVSGPALLAILIEDTNGAGGFFTFLMVLKTAKAVRVTRILRLIRVLKIFGKIQNAESVMTNRHIATVATSVVVAMVLVLVAAQYVPFLAIGNHEVNHARRMAVLEDLFSAKLQGKGRRPNQTWIVNYIANSPGFSDVIQLRKAGSKKAIYTNPNIEELKWKAFRHGAFDAIGDSGYEVQLSNHLADREHAMLNLFSLFMILTVVFVLMVLYSRTFAQQVADPIYIMNKGLRNWDYNLEVSINENYADDEVFQLARAYNERWLVIKNQIRSYRESKGTHAGGKSNISIDDII